MELLEAEKAAREKKRKADGKPALEDAPAPSTSTPGIEDDETNKRRKLLQEALELDKDDDGDDSSSEKSGAEANGDKKGEKSDSDDECVTF